MPSQYHITGPQRNKDLVNFYSLEFAGELTLSSYLHTCRQLYLCTNIYHDTYTHHHHHHLSTLSSTHFSPSTIITCISIHSPIHLSIHPSIHPCIYHSIYIHSFILKSIHLSIPSSTIIYPFLYLSTIIYPFLYLSIYPSMYR